MKDLLLLMIYTWGDFKNYTIEESAEKAIKAGATFLLYSNNPLAAKGYDNFKISYEIPAQIIAHFKKKIREGDLELEKL